MIIEIGLIGLESADLLHSETVCEEGSFVGCAQTSLVYFQNIVCIRINTLLVLLVNRVTASMFAMMHLHLRLLCLLCLLLSTFGRRLVGAKSCILSHSTCGLLQKTTCFVSTGLDYSRSERRRNYLHANLMPIPRLPLFV